MLVLGAISIPSFARADSYYSCADYPNYRYCDGKKDNPEPYLSSMNPSSVEKISDKITITLRGNDFIPSSIVKKNGINSPTVFVDSQTLIVDISANEVRGKSEIFLTVYNSEPAGGYSRALTFTIKSNIPKTSPTNNSNTAPKKTLEEKITSVFTQEKTVSSTTSKTNTNSSPNDINENYGQANALAATALLGESSFMPSGFFQWIIMLGALILIVVLWRYINHSKEIYMAEPMKHA